VNAGRRGLARAAAVLTVALGLLVLASVAWRKPPMSEAAKTPPTAPTAPAAPASAAPPPERSPAPAPRTAPAPLAVDRRDRMPAFLQALNSDDPAMITRGLLAAHECFFFVHNDPNDHQGAPAIGPDAGDTDRRREALALAQQRCGRFTLQQDVPTQFMALHVRMRALRPEVEADLAALHTWVLDPQASAATRDAGCAVLEKSLHDPWLAFRAGFELQQLLLRRPGRTPEAQPFVADRAQRHLLCTAQGRCDQPSTDMLVACALVGICDEGGIPPPGLGVMQEARALVQAIADGRCRDALR
jgi:hypothetical protein